MPRLLLIDDDTNLREVLAVTLALAGYHVVQAADGREGEKLFRAEPADLVISDLVMPDREGLETIAALRRDWPALPIIAISGGVPHSKVYLDMAARLGADRTLGKPFVPAALLQIVAELLGPRPAPLAG